MNITFTSDIKEALSRYQIYCKLEVPPGRVGMTREDLLKGNAAIAEEFGKNVKAYCPDVKHIVVIFNPADITGLITLLYSGLKLSQVTTLAALDSTRLRSLIIQTFRHCADSGRKKLPHVWRSRRADGSLRFHRKICKWRCFCLDIIALN